jgi:hypothetical protein
LLQIEIQNLEVLLQATGIVGLGDDSNTSLSGPAKKDLRRCLASSSGGLLDRSNIPEQWYVAGSLPESWRELQERLRAEGRICSNENAPFLGQTDEFRLYQIRMVFYLQRGYRMAAVSIDVVQNLSLSVRDANGSGDARINDFFKRLPCLL